MAFCYANIEKHQANVVIDDSSREAGLFDVRDLGDSSYLGPTPNGQVPLLI
jgi:hypothetical protein